MRVPKGYKVPLYILPEVLNPVMVSVITKLAIYWMQSKGNKWIKVMWIVLIYHFGKQFHITFQETYTSNDAEILGYNYNV